ncbi:sensor histidine kinase, partial [Microbacteriaceae bacterium 4G12]
VCINELIEQLMEELVPQAEENALYFQKELPGKRLFIHADPDKIVRVFENLLGNAIKYSHKPGKIIVKARATDSNVQISIENYSDELTSEELERLFDRFYKHDESRSMAAEGSGLGLAITKSIVELHNGKVWAECEDELIRFLVQLPIVTNRPII